MDKQLTAAGDTPASRETGTLALTQAVSLALERARLAPEPEQARMLGETECVRQKLGDDPATPRWLRTDPDVGYRFLEGAGSESAYG